MTAERRPAVGLAWGTVALLAAAAAGYVAFERTRPAGEASCGGCDVVLVTIDTLRVDRVGAYGSRAGLTPTIDRLAESGARVEYAYSAAPLTLPAHASLLTGVPPPVHGVRDNGIFRLGDSLPTLATVLQAAGYETGAFVGAFVLDERFGLARGFDEYDARMARRGEGRDVAERPAAEVVRSAAAWLAQRGAQPWFLWAHFYDPHAPYEPPEPWASRFGGYDGEVASVDAQLARLLAAADAARHGRGLLVIVTSDHGESLGDHGEATHGVFAYDATLRVTLVMSGPSIRPTVVKGVVPSIDLAPTVLERLGVAAPAAMEGRLLRAGDALDRAADDPHPAYFEAMNAHLTRGWAPLSGLVSRGWKLIDLPTPELYDLRKDPAESNNRYRDEPDLARELTALLDGMRSEQRANQAGESRLEPDPDTRRRLESLGYTVGDRRPPGAPVEADGDPKALITTVAAVESADALFARGDEASAIARLRAVLERLPANTDAAVALARMLERRGAMDEALAVMERAAAQVTTDPSLTVTWAALLMRAGRVAEAAARLELLVARQPDYLDGREMLAAAYAKAGRVGDARVTLERVLAVDPSSASALENLAVLDVGAGRLSEALERVERSVALDSSRASAYAVLGYVYSAQGRAADAEQAWQAGLTLEPDNLEMHFNLGRLLAERGDLEQARPHLQLFVAHARASDYPDQRRAARRLLGKGQ